MKKIHYIGVDDPTMHLFESQYVTPEGMCYNSYLIEDEKIAVMDTVDPRKTEEWLEKLAGALKGRRPDYLVVHHMEPDHAGSIAAFVSAYPETQVVASQKALQMMAQFMEPCPVKNSLAIKEGDTLALGEHTLTFVAAPMVHWPEVMMSYESSEHVLFAADGFGKFGVYDADPDDWACEARRYYFNICGKYGTQVSAVLKKAAGLQIDTICPLHGPVLEGEKLAEALRLYTIWSAYGVETEGVLVAHASIHGNTARAAEKFADILRAKGAKKVVVADLCRDDMAEVIEDAFRMGHLVVAAASYDATVFPPMQMFLWKLAAKGYQKRTVGIIENGSWAPTAARVMKSMIEPMKDIKLVEPVVTIKSTLKAEDMPQMEALAYAVLAE